MPATICVKLTISDRTPAFLAQSIVDAKKNRYALGVKLVRGAYHPHEIEVHSIALGTSPLGPAQSILLIRTEVNSRQRRRACSPSVSPDTLPPVWSTKDETDLCYNECLRVLLRAVTEDIGAASAANMMRNRHKARPPTVGVLFGTHNWKSCNLVLDELVACGLGSKVKDSGEGEVVQLVDAVTERVTIGQLYGVSLPYLWRHSYHANLPMCYR
jgi:proline dehydrogenase